MEPISLSTAQGSPPYTPVVESSYFKIFMKDVTMRKTYRSGNLTSGQVAQAYLEKLNEALDLVARKLSCATQSALGATDVWLITPNSLFAADIAPFSDFDSLEQKTTLVVSLGRTLKLPDETQTFELGREVAHLVNRHQKHNSVPPAWHWLDAAIANWISLKNSSVDWSGTIPAACSLDAPNNLAGSVWLLRFLEQRFGRDFVCRWWHRAEENPFAALREMLAKPLSDVIEDFFRWAFEAGALEPQEKWLDEGALDHSSYLLGEANPNWMAITAATEDPRGRLRILTVEEDRAAHAREPTWRYRKVVSSPTFLQKTTSRLVMIVNSGCRSEPLVVNDDSIQFKLVGSE